MIKHLLSEYKILKKYKKKFKSFFFVIIFSLFFLFLLSFIISVGDMFEYDNYKAKTNIINNYDFEANIYINDKFDTNIFTNLLKNSVDNATTSIKSAVFSIDMPSFKNKLTKAHQRGVNIDIISDKSKEQQYIEFFEGQSFFNLSLAGDDSTGLPSYMHHKYTVFDENTKNEKIIIGSFNYTVIQEAYDPSFILETNDSSFIGAFKEENLLLMDKISGRKKLREEEYNPFNRHIEYNNGFIDIWFSPGFNKNSIKQKMLDMINSAEKEINIMTWRFKDYDIMDALIKKSQEGIKVKIMLDDYYMWSKGSAVKQKLYYLDDNNNLEIISDLYKTLDLKNNITKISGYFNPYLHQHAMIIDNKTVLTGTNNWTNNGFNRNDENVFISDISFIVQKFQESFNYNYKLLRNENLDIKIEDSQLVFNKFKDSYKDKNLRIYKEFSEVEIIPPVCFETKMTYDSQRMTIPKECITKESAVFILDEEFNVVANSYLYW